MPGWNRTSSPARWGHLHLTSSIIAGRARLLGSGASVSVSIVLFLVAPSPFFFFYSFFLFSTAKMDWKCMDVGHSLCLYESLLSETLKREETEEHFQGFPSIVCVCVWGWGGRSPKRCKGRECCPGQECQTKKKHNMAFTAGRQLHKRELIKKKEAKKCTLLYPQLFQSNGNALKKKAVVVFVFVCTLVFGCVFVSVLLCCPV